MLRLGESATLELFEYSVEDQTSPIRPDGLGFQHIGIYVDDIDAIGERVEAAGGELMTGPNLMKGPEEGAGNATWYMRTPWGQHDRAGLLPPQPETDRGRSRGEALASAGLPRSLTPAPGPPTGCLWTARRTWSGHPA